jgi:DNA-binding transcriptional regulator/RsmH inhibitor MraZ
VTSRVELWSKEQWSDYSAAANFIDDELGEYMKAIGF